MAHFRFAVSGQNLDLLTPTRGISDGININSAEFDFRSPEWEGAEKWAHFTNADTDIGVLLEDDAISAERGLNLATGIWDVYLHGDILENGEITQRLVTESQSIQIVQSGLAGTEIIPVTPSEGEQILAKATAAYNDRIVSASVESTTVPGGEASVSVEITGENGEKNIGFQFTNLKGEKGDKGDKGDTGPMPELDPTFSIAGKAADAKATGDLVAGVASRVSAIENLPVNSIGNPLVVQDGIDGLPVRDLKIRLNPKQSGSGDPAPDNVRPFTPYTGTTVYRTGKNLLQLVNWRSIGGTTFSIQISDAGVFSCFGTISSVDGRFYPFFDRTYPPKAIPLPPGDYVLSGGLSNDVYLTLYNGPDTSSPVVSCTGEEVQFTCTGYICYPRLVFNYGAVIEGLTVFPMLRRASDSSEWSSMCSGSYPVEFPEVTDIHYDAEDDIYGCEYDFTTGVLSVDRQLIKIDEDSYVGVLTSLVDGNSSVSLPEDYVGTVFVTYPDADYNVDKAGVITSNYLKPVSPDYMLLNDGYFVSFPADASNRLWFRLPGISTVEDAKAYLQDHNLYIFYSVSGPDDYQLIPTEISLLSGYNFLWGDIDSELSLLYGDYLRAIKGSSSAELTALKEMIAPVETGYSATRAYSAGDFLFVGKTLYRVTDDLVFGDDLNGSIEATTLDDYFGSIRNGLVHYCVCETAAATVAKTASTTDPFFRLETGTIIAVKFTNDNSAYLPTLNVNGTGAKAMCQYGSSKSGPDWITTGWPAGAVQMFVYDGTNWVRDYWMNSLANVFRGQGYGTCTTAADNDAKVVTISGFRIMEGGIVTIKFDNDVGANATLNIGGTGAKDIYYKGAAITAGVIHGGDIVTFMLHYRVYAWYEIISII